MSEPARERLPIAERPPVSSMPYDARDPDVAYPPIERLLPPAGAPNVLVVLLDDVGFGASSAFGGPCQTPNIDRLAARGLRYDRFHTTALCSPTRQALLTGRNHHSVGMGGITELATSAPGYSSIRPKTTAPLAKTLTYNGYSTAQFGKCHEVPVWETSPMGPFDGWPSGGGGFEHFYGFIGGETNQYEPAIYNGTTPIETPVPADGEYHLTEDLADQAVDWMRQQKALMPDRPFFAYFAPGATHAPHHVPTEWADRYAGEFDDGWDSLRERSVVRQRELGVIPEDAELTRRHDEIPAWNDVPDELKPVLARQMEVYAGFLSHTDHHVGRLISALEDLEILEDTLVYVIVGDNGASAEGGIHGSFNELLAFNGVAALETPEFLTERIDKFGTREAYNHYAVGWAHAMDCPYQWTKQVASHWGGTRNGTVVHWPRGIRASGEHRNQFCHVIDVAPTILEAAGIPQPLSVDGIDQRPIEGTSMRYSFDDPDAAERHSTQYFEMFGNRGIYHRGWTAVTKHRTPWELASMKIQPFDDDVWELYAPDDWTQAHDIAAEQPAMLHELQRRWLIEASRFGVLPLDDRAAERFDAASAGRPQFIQGSRQLLFPHMGRLSENSVVNVKNRSFSITAEMATGDGEPDGTIIAQGGAFGGWSLGATHGRLAFTYNYCGIERVTVTAEAPLPSGEHQVRVEFDYDGGGAGRGGDVTLYADGSKVGAGRLERTMALIFSGDETTDVGREFGSLVGEANGRPNNPFTGDIRWVQLDVSEDADADHVVSPEERVRIAMSRQ